MIKTIVRHLKLKKPIFIFICITVIILSINTYCFAIGEAVGEVEYGYGVRVGIIDSGVNKINGNILEGFNFLENNTDTEDYKGHGTSIASVISEAVPNAKIIPLKCTELNQITDNTAIIAAIYKAIDNFDCDVINISMGMPNSVELKEAIDYAVNSGAIIVSAVGNDGELAYKAGKVYYPAGYENVVGVGSIDETNVISDYSQKNESVFTVAFCKIKGTSFSAAKISGVAAIAKGFNKRMTTYQFMKYIKESSTDLGNIGYDKSYGNGVLNLEQFLENLKTDNPVYITSLDEQKFRLYNGSKQVVEGILIFISDDFISEKIKILPNKEMEFNINDSKDCVFWPKNTFDLVWIKRGEL